MSASCSAHGCKSLLPRHAQIGKCCYRITGLVKGSIHGCLFLCRFASCDLCRDRLPVTARAGTRRCGVCTELHVKTCWAVAVCGQSLGGQMAAAVLMRPHVVQYESCWLKPTLAFSCPGKFFIIACLVWFLTRLVNTLSSKTFKGLLFCPGPVHGPFKSCSSGPTLYCADCSVRRSKEIAHTSNDL